MSEKLYGLNKTTLIDYPGKVAATIFTRGCNMRCPYCHNPELVTGAAAEDMLTWSQIKAFLNKRAHMLGGICITGGEPLLHDDLTEMISDIHEYGMSVKIDTNGTLPEKLRLIKADYIAMDIKTSIGKYNSLGYTGNTSELRGRLLESIKIIQDSGVKHHFRTTVVPGLVTPEDIEEIIRMIGDEKTYVLQGFRPGITLDPEYSDHPGADIVLLESMQKLFKKSGIECSLKYNSKD